ncbi:uncharacterized protein [Panulirus ornatus]|uniref:uncharacterized protein n=1 Tax=Panulirus ornatus TaxID=150431 RepID=UPI003A8C22D1
MWKAVLLVIFANAVLQRAEAVGGGESVSFPGYIPDENIRAKAPEGDGQINDIYLHLVSQPTLGDDEVILYPRRLDFGLGIEDDQDPEAHVYHIVTTDELAQLEQTKHGKHGKHAHNHKGTKDATKSISKLKPLAGPVSAPISDPQTNFHPSYPSPPPGAYPHPHLG